MNHPRINPMQALECLQDDGPLLDRAKGERVYCEEFRKTLKSRLMSQAPGKSAVDREAWAYAHFEYAEHISGLAAAVEKEKALRWRVVAAQAAIDIWRSQNASNRAMDRSSS